MFLAARISKFQNCFILFSFSASVVFAFFSCRIGLIVICSLLVCVALYMIKPRAGIIAAVVCIIICATAAIKDRDPVDFEDITTGFMIRQLIDANSLIADRGKFTFVHGQNHTVLEESANVSGTERMTWNISKRESGGSTEINDFQNFLRENGMRLRGAAMSKERTLNFR